MWLVCVFCRSRNQNPYVTSQGSLRSCEIESQRFQSLPDSYTLYKKPSAPSNCKLSLNLCSTSKASLLTPGSIPLLLFCLEGQNIGYFRGIRGINFYGCYLCRNPSVAAKFVIYDFNWGTQVTEWILVDSHCVAESNWWLNKWQEQEGVFVTDAPFYPTPEIMFLWARMHLSPLAGNRHLSIPIWLNQDWVMAAHSVEHRCSSVAAHLVLRLYE